MSSKTLTLPTTIFKNTLNIVLYSANKTEAIGQEFLSPFKYQIHLHLPIFFLLTTTDGMSYLPILDTWSKKIYHFFWGYHSFVSFFTVNLKLFTEFITKRSQNALELPKLNNSSSFRFHPISALLQSQTSWSVVYILCFHFLISHALGTPQSRI